MLYATRALCDVQRKCWPTWLKRSVRGPGLDRGPVALSGASQWGSILRALLVYGCGSWPKKGVSMRDHKSIGTVYYYSDTVTLLSRFQFDSPARHIAIRDAGEPPTASYTVRLTFGCARRGRDRHPCVRSGARLVPYPGARRRLPPSSCLSSISSAIFPGLPASWPSVLLYL